MRSSSARTEGKSSGEALHIADVPGEWDVHKPRLGSEFELIARYFAPLARGFPGAYGLLDDVALINPAPGNELAVKTDTIVGGVDFLADTPPELIARKALRVNLSDLAAKAAVPRAYLIDLVLPDTVDEAWIAAFAAGLAHDQDEYGVHLVGGDMSSTSGPIVIAVTALGEVALGRVVRRGGAQPNDTVFVTGTIGDAVLGLSLLDGTLTGLEPASAAFLSARYRLPEPRVALGRRLAGIASAAIDVSDGLVADLRHVCGTSQLSAIIEAKLVPLSHAARKAIGDDRARLARALTGGDDYEILFTAPAVAAARVAELSRSSGVAISAIGRMVPPAAGDQASVVVLDDSGRPIPFASEGWTHFRRGPRERDPR